MRVDKYYVPRSLDLEALKKLGRAEYVEKLLFFISTMHIRTVANRSIGEDDYIPLHADILGKFIRKNDVARVRTDLIRLGIIECDYIRIMGKKSYGHKFTRAYKGERLTVVPARFKKTKEQDAKDMKKQHEYIKATLERVTIEDKAFEQIEADYFDCVKKYNANFVSCDLIRDKNWFFSTDFKTGRVFNNVANLGRDLRPYLRLDGKPLVEVDISNSQPMLLHYLYADKTRPEAKRYKALVESGRFYEVMAAAAGLTRDEAKKLFLACAFGEVKYAESSKFGQAFSQTFPELRAIMDEIKNEDYRKLSQFLTKLEAELVINTVVPLCQERGIPVLTIHDSLMVLPEHVGAVRAMLQSECMRLYNLCPVLKTKGASTEAQACQGKSVAPVEYLEAA